MTSWGNYFVKNVRQLDSSQNMCSIVLMLSTKILVPLAKLRFSFKLQYITHLAMEGLNIVAYFMSSNDVITSLLYSSAAYRGVTRFNSVDFQI